MLRFRTGLATGILLASTSLAGAVCPGVDVLYEEPFDELRTTWGEASAVVGVEEGRLVIAPASGTYEWVASSAALYDDVDMCVTVTTVLGVAPADAFAGLVFWYEDVNNFYVFEMAPNGNASVWRRQRGRWLPQVAWRDVESANAGDGVANELRITTIADAATFYVNGIEFATLTGSPPAAGQQIGLLAASPEQGEARFAFDDLRVTAP
jgi:hypothetical protein